MRRFVYVISTEGGAPIKVGVTGDLRARLMTLRQLHGDGLVLEHSRETEHAQLMERVLLHRLKFARLHGEWFNVSVDRAREALDDLPGDVDGLIALAEVIGRDAQRHEQGNPSVTAAEARVLLEKSGLKQVELAAAMSRLTDRSYSPQTVSAWFRDGGRGPSDACVIFLKMLVERMEG